MDAESDNLLHHNGDNTSHDQDAAPDILNCRKTAFFLDVDGTLLALAGTPGGVTVSGRLRALLTELKFCANGAAALISGRRLSDLDALFAPLRLAAAGQHGAEWRDAAGRQHSDAKAHESLESLRPALASLEREYPGTLLEDKGESIAVHYRSSPSLKLPLKTHLDNLLTAHRDLEISAGKMVWEIRDLRANKGTAIERLMQDPPFASCRMVFAGDDVTDEDGFEYVNSQGGYTIKVGPGESCARYRLRDHEHVLDWLEQCVHASHPEKK